MGWIDPKGKWFQLQRGENHEDVAIRLLKKIYQESGAASATRILVSRGWVRQASIGQYSVHSIRDSWTGVMRKNLRDAIEEVPDGKIYIDADSGPSDIGYKGDLLDKYA